MESFPPAPPPATPSPSPPPSLAQKQVMAEQRKTLTTSMKRKRTPNAMHRYSSQGGLNGQPEVREERQESPVQRPEAPTKDWNKKIILKEKTKLKIIFKQ